MHAEEPLQRVAVLHGGPAVAVDERPGLLPGHARAVGDLLLGVLAPVRFQPCAAQQVEALQKTRLDIRLARGTAAEQGLEHRLRDPAGDGEPPDVEDLGVRHTEPVGEPGDAGDDSRQLSGFRGARILVAIRHRQNSYVSRGLQGVSVCFSQRL